MDKVIFEVGECEEFPCRAVYYRNGEVLTIVETASYLRSFGWSVVNELIEDLFKQDSKQNLIAAGWTEEALQKDAELLAAAERREAKQAEADAADEAASLPSTTPSNLFAIYRDGNPNVWILEVYGEAKAKELCRTLNNNFNLDAFFTQRVS